VPAFNQVGKSFATQTLAGALQFTQDMKLGHYMKIPPRITFFGEYSFYAPCMDVNSCSTCAAVQIVAATVACLTAFAVKLLLFAYVDDICSPTQADQFSQ
jgi:hypothetical protein